MQPAPKWYLRPFVPLLLALMGGIAIGVHLPQPPMRILAVFMVIASAAGTVACLLRSKASRVFPLILFLGLGTLSILPWSAPRFPDHHIVHFADGPRYKITGVVSSPARQVANRTRFLLAVDTLSDKRSSRKTCGLLRVTAVGDEIDLKRGDRIELISRIRSIRNFNNPGGFDFRRYMAFQKVWATAYSPAEKLRLLNRTAGSRPQRALDAVRSRVIDLIDQTRQGPHRDVLRALILGDRSRISPALREAFHRSGVGHLLAISGLHIGIVAGGAFIVLVAVFSRFEFMLWNAWVRKAAAIGAFLPAFAYALLAGMSPSTQRALVMVGVFLLTFLLQRQQDSINTLAVAAVVILLIHPPALYSISFQLSFLAVFFIIVSLTAIQPADGMPPPSIAGRIRRKLASFIFVTLAATAGTLPLVMTYFQQVSLIAVFTNCVFVPLIGFAVVPLGLFSALALWVCPTVAAWGMHLAGGLLEVGIAGIDWAAALRFAAVDTFIPSTLEIGCYYLLMASLLGLILGWRNARSGPAPVRPEGGPPAENRSRLLRFMQMPERSRRWAAVAVLAAAVAIADAGYWVYYRFYRSDLRVTILDVGQGSAALLELPKGACILADGGGFSDNAVFDVGARVLAPLLRRKKILTVETLILSHPNSDHLNGLIHIADRFGVKRILTNGETRNTLGYRRLRAVLDRRHIREITCSDQARELRLAGVRLEVLYPPSGFLQKRQRELWRDINNNSLVCKISLGSVSFLFFRRYYRKGRKGVGRAVRQPPAVNRAGRAASRQPDFQLAEIYRGRPSANRCGQQRLAQSVRFSASRSAAALCPATGADLSNRSPRRRRTGDRWPGSVGFGVAR